MKNYDIDDHLMSLKLECERAEGIHPNWPEDPIHQVAIMVEEAGEAMQAALQMVYEDGSAETLTKELIQTGAMVVRCLKNLEDLE